MNRLLLLLLLCLAGVCLRGQDFGKLSLAQNRKGRFGLKKPNGRWLVRPKYDSIRPFVEDRAMVKRKDLWGIINREGDVILEPKYLEIRDYIGGLAAAAKYNYSDEKEWCYLNKSTVVAIKKVKRKNLVEVTDFHKAVAFVRVADIFQNKGKHYYVLIDSTGKMLEDYIRRYSKWENGRCRLQICTDKHFDGGEPYLYVYIDEEGKDLTPRSLDNFYLGASRQILHVENGREVVINQKGQEISARYKSIEYLANEQAYWASTSKEQHLLLDTNMQVLIPEGKYKTISSWDSSCLYTTGEVYQLWSKRQQEILLESSTPIEKQGAYYLVNKQGYYSLWHSQKQDFVLKDIQDFKALETGAFIIKRQRKWNVYTSDLQPILKQDVQDIKVCYMEAKGFLMIKENGLYKLYDQSLKRLSNRGFKGVRYSEDTSSAYLLVDDSRGIRAINAEGRVILDNSYKEIKIYNKMLWCQNSREGWELWNSQSKRKLKVDLWGDNRYFEKEGLLMISRRNQKSGNTEYALVDTKTERCSPYSSSFLMGGLVFIDELQRASEDIVYIKKNRRTFYFFDWNKGFLGRTCKYKYISSGGSSSNLVKVIKIVTIVPAIVDGVRYMTNKGRPVKVKHCNARFFRDAKPYSEGLAAVRDYEDLTNYESDLLYGYVNEEAKIVIPLQFGDARPFSEGWAVVQDRERKLWGVINKKGELVVDLKYQMIGDIKRGKVEVETVDGEKRGLDLNELKLK